MASTKEEKILQLEEEIRASKARHMTTTNQAYGGPGKSLELFNNANNNIVKNPDLMPCPRRPAKK